MAGVLDDFMDTLKKKGSDFMTGVDHLNPVSNLNRAAEALGSAGKAGDDAALKAYTDKYGPNQGARIYADDQAKKKAAAGGK